MGKLPFISEEHSVQTEVAEKVEDLQLNGKTSVVSNNHGGVEGIIALTDEIKAESLQVVTELKSLGVAVVMMTGDNYAPARTVAREVGISEVKAEMLPENKGDGVKELHLKYGETAMVGDGVNDAPALAVSSVGIAMGAVGSDTAIEAASIAILNDRLEMISYLIRLGRKTIQSIKLNIIFAVATKLMFVILAALGLTNNFSKLYVFLIH
ncbi:MAG TPA: HAD-IC family P-type ATPase [Pyrinomonadaceae bacterium]|nr:HAD-IC family P-type ATPase [Pyrinomonadaceae bacterium]